jgi:ferredoxin-NADP reductase
VTLPTVPDDATAYICGSSPFADGATDLAMAIGIPTQRIRIERFGPTGWQLCAHDATSLRIGYWPGRVVVEGTPGTAARFS